MTIKEIEERTGLDRANIRFYEKEGLLAPQRLANGYRNYTEQDVDTLLRIKLLRSLHLPLEEIRTLQSGEKTLESAVQAHLRTLETEKHAVSAAEDVCRAMQADHARYDNLNANKYLLQLQCAPQTESTYFSLPKEDTAPHPAHPWRRYFARTLDLNLYTLPWELIYLLVLRTNPESNAGTFAVLVSTVLSFVLMLLIEPALLHFFGTTPGKWIFGLRIVNDDGSKLTYEEGIQRTWGVIRYGYGFGIPFYDFYRQWKCYKLCKNGEEQDWDEFPLRRLYTIQDTKLWRNIAWFTATTVLVIIIQGTTEISALPPNRGELTVAEFAENYNYLLDYYTDSTPSYTLDETGAWQEAPMPLGQIVIRWEEGPSGPTPLEYFTDENGYLTGITLKNENGSLWEMLDPDRFILAALAWITAQPDGGPFSGAASYTIQKLDISFPKEIQFTEAGISVSFQSTLENENTSYCFSLTKEPQP